MKRRLIVLSTILTLSASILAGCGNSAETTQADEQTQAVEEVSSETTEVSGDESSVGIANPWVEITEEEAAESCYRLFKAPEGATNVVWRKNDSLADPDKVLGPLVELDFTLDDMDFTARAQQGAAEDADITGVYEEWAVGPEEVTLANWGGGNMKGNTFRAVNDAGFTDLITWYDIEIGIAYSLTVSAADLDGFDIQAVAEQMYAAENDEASGPDDFLQEQAGKTEFDSFDDAIANLTTGQGYAYIKLQGSDEELLAVTDLAFEYDHSAYEASIYGMKDGKVKYMSLVTGNGSAYPLRLADGIIYGGDNHTYETFFVSEEFGSLMAKDYISDGVNSGTNEFVGFTRENNSFDEPSKDFIGGQEEFEKLLAEREEKPIIEFTVVK